MRAIVDRRGGTVTGAGRRGDLTDARRPRMVVAARPRPAVGPLRSIRDQALVGTRGDELLFIRVLADLDPSHIRCLRIMAAGPPHLDTINRQRLAVGEPPVRQWHPSDIAHQDPGLKDSVWALLPVLASHQLIYGGDRS